MGCPDRILPKAAPDVATLRKHCELHPPTTMLFDQISTDIMSAMKAHDKVRTQALRNVKKYFIEAKTAPGSNGELTDEAAMKILAKLVFNVRETS